MIEPDFTPTRTQLEGWSTKTLHVSAMDCVDEFDPDHCWRCLAFDVWLDRVFALGERA